MAYGKNPTQSAFLIKTFDFAIQVLLFYVSKIRKSKLQFVVSTCQEMENSHKTPNHQLPKNKPPVANNKPSIPSHKARPTADISP